MEDGGAGAGVRCGCRPRLHIHIEKRLPVQGGIGAGSANAVAALIGLERELARAGVAALAGPERLRIAAEVGSDVPLFLIGGTVLGEGRGEEVSPLRGYSVNRVRAGATGGGGFDAAGVSGLGRSYRAPGTGHRAQGHRLQHPTED
jgi:4-diphosphocytidyl-2C-methyl-D-erythritol kinase